MHLRPRVTYGNVVSTVALFVTLGGVSWAISTLPRNSVGTAQFKAGAVTARKIKVLSRRAADLAHGQLLAGPRGRAGAEGPVGTGAQGSAGPPGAAGPAGPAGHAG